GVYAGGAAAGEKGSYLSNNDNMVSGKNPDIVGRDDYPTGITAPWRWNEWNNGASVVPDGPFINKADEGSRPQSASDGLGLPYMWFRNAVKTDDHFSPNRQVPSAGILGSLPTGVKRNQPWQTLLFRPDPGDNHPGAANPPDYLLMDWFWMPIVEPYAISEPFSTSGRVNMNYKIAPFDYINRTTALRAALESEKVVAIPSSKISEYKNPVGNPGARHPNPESFAWRSNASDTYRHDLDLTSIINQMNTAKFDNDEIYKSATEICTVDLLQTSSGGVRPAELTGDNMLEAPYTAIYPKLTTKSNTFRVHYRVQYLKQAKRAAEQDPEWQIWYEDRDQVLAEQRGSYLIERYIDPNDPNIVNGAQAGQSNDFAQNPNLNLEDFYQFRVLSHKKFAP
ncbi:MAG: Verru_Chthon cassette protein A, partial [Verrucomicrobiota bacterium]